MILANFKAKNTLPVSSNSFHWLFKYKLYHLPFWFVYHYLWWSLSSGFLDAANNIFFSNYTIKFAFYVIFQAIGVYFNLYYLIPKFLEKGKIITYVVSVILTILVTAALIITGYYLSAWWTGIPFKELFGEEPTAFFHFFKTNSFPSTVASMTLAMSIKLTKNWIESQQQAQLLKQEKLETELKFLKSQFNPHFLFNTINSIFVLIHKNPDRASESLAKFSNLMRYQLYDCNEQQIPLQQEVNYLENFIELEELRLESNFDLNLQIHRNLGGNWMIAPFILMPFVENAFKHVSQKLDGTDWVNIQLEVEDGELIFLVTNSISKTYKASPDVVKYGGLGLKNVQRRLDLLYPDQYKLSITSDDKAFVVRLGLKLIPNRQSENLKPELLLQ